MKILTIIARVLLGLAFTMSGVMGYVMVFGHMKMPPIAPGLPREFNDVFFRSHWVLVIDFFEFVGGVCVLLNRYLILGMTILAAILVNILTYHLTMQLANIAPGLVLTLLWAFLAYRNWDAFAPLFVAKRNMAV